MVNDITRYFEYYFGYSFVDKCSSISKNGESNNKLLMTGVYSMVRNPICSAFYFVLIGLLLIEANLWLLILPILFTTTGVVPAVGLYFSF